MRSLVTLGLVVVAACADGKPGSDKTPTSENHASAVAASQRQAGVNSALWPNEPAGYTNFGRMTGNAIPTTSGYTTPTGYVGKWKVMAGLSNISLTDDAAAPGDTNLITFQYPSGFGDGQAPFDVSFQPTDGVQRKALYFGAIFRIRSGGTDTTVYENHSAGTKWLSFLGAVEPMGSSAHNNFWFLMIPGNTRSTFHFNMKSKVAPAGVINYAPNLDASNIIVVGHWIRFETVIELNTIDSTDGRWRVWLTDLTQNPSGPATLVHDSTSMKWRITGAAQWFYGSDLWNFDPTWGGDNGSTKAQTDWFDMVEARFSGTT